MLSVIKSVGAAVKNRTGLDQVEVIFNISLNGFKIRAWSGPFTDDRITSSYLIERNNGKVTVVPLEEHNGMMSVDDIKALMDLLEGGPKC